MTQPTTPAPGEDSKGFWRNLILWALLALLLRWLVVEPRWIPSGSMLPTLQLQDRILVEKVRPRLARSRHGHLHRGDVVVFAPPEQLVAAGYDASAALIKRVVGLPGDQLEVHDGRLFRNGEQAAEPWLAEAINYENHRGRGSTVGDGGQPQCQPRFPPLGITAGNQCSGHGGVAVLAAAEVRSVTDHRQQRWRLMPMACVKVKSVM